MSGLAILNVGSGDTKLSFDPKNPAERIRAARIVRDMLRRGYALLVQVGEENGEPVYQRAHDFDETRCEYIIADLDPEAADQTAPFLKTEAEKSLEQGGEAAGDETAERAEAEPPRKRGRPSSATRRLPAATTPAVAVSRSAGG